MIDIPIPIKTNILRRSRSYGGLFERCVGIDYYGSVIPGSSLT